jgi:cell division protein FtsB
MSYERLSPVFVEAIKELEKKNIELKQEVTFLKEKIKVMCDKKTSNLLT